MPEHPLYTMWHQRYQAELAAEAERARHRGLRNEERRRWEEAWAAYECHWRDAGAGPKRRRWTAARDGCLALALRVLTPPAVWLASRVRGIRS